MRKSTERKRKEDREKEEERGREKGALQNDDNWGSQSIDK